MKVIYAEAAKQALIGWSDNPSDEEIEMAIDALPAAIDVEPVRHGRWAHGYYPTVWYDSGEPPEWICSLCHDRAYNTYDYCPNCGAKMDAKEENV